MRVERIGIASRHRAATPALFIYRVGMAHGPWHASNSVSRGSRTCEGNGKCGNEDVTGSEKQFTGRISCCERPTNACILRLRPVNVPSRHTGLGCSAASGAATPSRDYRGPRTISVSGR